jgi:hypothetical protein
MLLEHGPIPLRRSCTCTSWVKTLCFQHFSHKLGLTTSIIERTHFPCRYALQPSVWYPRHTNGRNDWMPIDKQELLCWFGVLVLMGLKDLPNIRLYWSESDFYGCPLIKSCISRQRFEAITRCIHLVDNSGLHPPGHPDHDKLGKVRWLVEHFSIVAQA